MDPTFVYVQALGVFGLEITKWALCCLKHWGRGWWFIGPWALLVEPC